MFVSQEPGEQPFSQAHRLEVVALAVKTLAGLARVQLRALVLVVIPWAKQSRNQGRNGMSRILPTRGSQASMPNHGSTKLTTARVATNASAHRSSHAVVTLALYPKTKQTFGTSSICGTDRELEVWSKPAFADSPLQQMQNQFNPNALRIHENTVSMAKSARE